MAAANTRRSASAQQTAEQGLIASAFTRLLQVLVFMMLTLFFSILIEWAGMAAHFWQEPGARHSEAMLDQELEYLNDDFKRSAIVEEPARFARNFADTFYDITFKKTGVQRAVIWLATPVPGFSDSKLQKPYIAFSITSGNMSWRP